MNQKKKLVCCLPICKGERFDLVHRFPRQTDRALKWLQVLNCPNLKHIPLEKLSQAYQVCSRHFRIEDYKHPQSRSLNMTAVPCLNLVDLSELHLAKDSTPKIERVGEGVPLLIERMQCELAKEQEESECTSKKVEIDCLDPLHLKDEEQQETLDDTPPEDEAIDMEVSTFFEVHHPRYAEKLIVNSYWLRCHCRCELCYDPITKRKLFSLMDIPTNIQSKLIEQKNNVDVLLIKWDDGHESKQDVNFLYRAQFRKEHRTINRTLWHRDSCSILEFAPIEFVQLVSCDQFIREQFLSIRQLGVCVVKNIPTQSLAMANLTLCRLFPQLEHLCFEEFNEIHTDVCTNVTYSNADCGLKCFFVTKQMDVILADGLYIAHELRISNAKEFKTLSEVPVPLEMSGPNVEWSSRVPIIETDQETEEILHLRLDVHRLGVLNTIPQTEVEYFYESLRNLIENVTADENQWRMTLTPGTMVILDNWRVFHKCLGSSGISQSYVDRKDFVARLRYLGLV